MPRFPYIIDGILFFHQFSLLDIFVDVHSQYEALLEELTEEDKETFNSYLEAAKVQGFQWTKKEYEFCDEAGRKTGDHVIMSFNENDFLTLAQLSNAK